MPDLVADVGVAFNGDEAGSDRVHGDTGRGEFAGPAAGQAYLRAVAGRPWLPWLMRRTWVRGQRDKYRPAAGGTRMRLGGTTPGMPLVSIAVPSRT